MDIRIVVLQRGWVAVGHYREEGEKRFLSGASILRRWGTTKGLGELVDGPLKTTQLDACGDLQYEAVTEIFNLKAKANKWAAKCA